MKRFMKFFIVFVVGFAVGAATVFHFNHRSPVARNIAVDSFYEKFSPAGGCTEAVVAEIESASNSILVQAYSFTSHPIADALIAAKKRGVDVKIVLDESQLQGNGSLLEYVSSSGIPTLLDCKHAIAHNKVIVIDSQVVITGSFNFTAAAEKSNAENLFVFRSHDGAMAYENNWRDHANHSVSPSKARRNSNGHDHDSRSSGKR